MRSFVEILSPGNADCGSIFHIFLDGIRYQFGCGDGAQRTATEAGVKPAKLAAIFLPSLSPTDVGGLPGMLLTAADSGLKRIMIAGPVGLSAYLRAASSFFMRPDLEMEVVEIGEERVAVKTSTISVCGIPIPETQPPPRTAETANGNPDQASDAAAHMPSVAFIARLADIPGRFDPKKAAALNVPRGRLYGVLQKGATVTLEDGTEVRPSQVMGAATPGPVVAMLPLLAPRALAGVFSHPALSPAALETGGARVSLLLHLSASAALLDTRYQAWAAGLGAGVQHVALHADFAPERVIFAANVEEVQKLHYTVDRALFPLPAHSTRPHVPSPNPALDPLPAQAAHPPACAKLPPRVWLPADFQLRVALAPAADAGRVDRANVPDARVPRDPAAPARPWGGARGGARKRARSDDAQAPPPAARAATVVRFLGTGGALPGKHRNVSCVHVARGARGGALLDCGEGSFGQLVRALGRAGAAAALRDLRVAFLSHMHADHHLGLPRVLCERAALGGGGGGGVGAPVAVVGPAALRGWLEAAVGGGTMREQVAFFDARALTDPQGAEARFFADSLGLELGTVAVVHCPDAFAAVLADTAERWKVVYSGDTRPCERLVEAGRDATLLIHEATLDDRFRDEARAKMHSTTEEALGIAERMGAWRTVLTHFSQRYPKVTALDARTVARMESAGACLASDFMTVGFDRLEELPGLTQVLREVYEEEVEELLANAPLPVEGGVAAHPT